MCDGASVNIQVVDANDSITKAYPSSYLWSPSTGLSATTGDGVSASPTITTTYSIKETINSGATACANDTVKLPFTITVTPAAPALTFIPSSGVDTILKGCSATLKAISTGNNYFTWSPGDGLNTVLGDSVLASPTITTTYTVYEENTSNNSLGCCGNNSITVKVEQLTASASHSTICVGDSSTLSVGTGQGRLANYQWSPSTGLSATNGSSVIATPTATTTYTVSACSDSAATTVVITVNPLPTISVSFPDEPTYDPGNPISAYPFACICYTPHTYSQRCCRLYMVSR